MKLFYIQAEDSEGEDLSLFAHADAPDTAVQLWRAYYAGSNDPHRGKVMVYDLSQTALCPGAMIWELIPREQFTGITL